MKPKITKTCLILLPAILMFCGKTEKILIDGSSTVYPITEAVAEEYRKVNPKVNVTVGISGTGGGFKKFCQGELDIANASRSIKEKEIAKCKEKNLLYWEFPIAYDGLAIVVHKDNQFIKQLTVEQLRKIFTAKNPAKKWNEVDPSFPQETIKVFAPGQDSGTFDYFVEAILGKDEKVRADATFSEDDNVLVTGVSGDKNSIGFFGVAYYLENKAKLGNVAVVNPQTLKPEMPTVEAVRSGKYAPLSRPLFIYVSKAVKQKESTNKFVEYYLKNANNLSKDVGYIPMPEENVRKNEKTFSEF